MRWTGCTILGAACALSHAQMIGASQAVRSAVKVWEPRDPATTRPANQQDPMQPQGFPGLPGKAEPLPGPAAGIPEDNQLRILRAGEVSRSGNLFRATGGVRLQFRGYDIFASTVEGDLNTEVFDAIGDVSVYGDNAVIRGARVRVVFPERSYQAWDSEAQVSPTLLQGHFLDPIYVKASESSGTERELFGVGTRCTTCSYDTPHFHLDAARTTIRPGTRAIFRDVRFSVLGKTILRLPYLSIPLTEPSYRYLPEFGRTEQDGYYMRARYGIPLQNDSNNLDARFDYFEKRGTALGGDYNYVSQAAQGLLSIYALTGLSRTLNISNRHVQKLAFGTLTLDNSYQRNNFFTAPESTLLSNRVQFAIPQRSGNTNLTFYRTENESSAFRSEQQTIGINDTRRFGARTRSTLDVNWAASESGTFEREQVDLRLQGEHDLKQAMAKFEYQRAIPVGDIQNFFSPSDKTPVISFASDARRLFGERNPLKMPFTTEVSVGELVDSTSRNRIGRGLFDFQFNRPDASPRRMRLNVNGRFRQSMYSDDTAQYVLNFGSHLVYSLGRDTAINIRYNYLRPHGFTPLQIDRTGETNLFTVDASFRPIRQFLIGAQSGYDLLAEDRGKASPWQSVGVRTEYDATSYIRLRALSTYDTVQRLWSNVRVDLTYRPGATLVSIGARYDGVRQVWGDLNMYVDGFKWGRLKTSVLLQYNGYLQTLQAQHYSFIYDLHCAEAVLEVVNNETGFRSGQQITFFLRLKALPSSSPFGVGTFGQPLGTGTGRRF